MVNSLFSSLLGGAIGDSLGAEIEFMSAERIREIFPDGIDRILPHQGVDGAITDDTQMTLFTLEGLVRAKENGTPITEEVHKALLRWLVTQDGHVQHDIGSGGLIDDRRLWAIRAPGLTCTGALLHARAIGAPAKNDSKGCGTIMRVAPVAFCVPEDQIWDVAIETSALTHGHITGHLAAAAWAVMLHTVSKGANLHDAAQDALIRLGSNEDGRAVSEAIQDALNAPRDGSVETVHSLGGGWTAETALATALYACLAAQSAEDGWKIAVNHSGDSDSTGAIAGNMLGLLYPDEVLNHPWAAQIECIDLMEDLARQFYS